MPPPVVLLDACTLYPATLRDVWMRLAAHGLIKARWTASIHDEWIEAVLRDRPDLTRERLQRTCELMNLHAEDSLVTGRERHLETLRLPDPNDRHVLAAAIEAEANTLLTWNLKDFPAEELAKHGVAAESPDTFLVRLLADHPDDFVRVLREARTSLKNPPLTAGDYLEKLHDQGLVRTCAILIDPIKDV